MLYSPYSGMADMILGVISENMSKKKSDFFCIFQLFHFESTIKI